jgi:hypothetical protein
MPSYLLDSTVHAVCDSDRRSDRLPGVCCHTSTGCSSSPEHGNCLCWSGLSCGIAMARFIECFATTPQSGQLRPAPGYSYLDGNSRNRSYNDRPDRPSLRADALIEPLNNRRGSVHRFTPLRMERLTSSSLRHRPQSTAALLPVQVPRCSGPRSSSRLGCGFDHLPLPVLRG